MTDKQIITTILVGSLTLVTVGGYIAIRIASRDETAASSSVVATGSPSTNPAKKTATSIIQTEQAAKPPPSTSPQKSAEQREIEQLRLENERLRTLAAQQVSTAPAPVPIPVAELTGISGSAWLTRSNASSDLLRGLRVHLLRRTMPVANVERCLAVDVQEWKQVMTDFFPPKQDDQHGQRELFEKELAKRVNRAKEQSFVGGTIETKEAIALVANLYVDKRAAMQNIIAVGEAAALEFQLERNPLAAQLQTITNQARADLMRLVARSNRISLDGMVIADCVTDADGTFRLENVPAGDYCLSAETSSTVLFVEWAIPIQIQGAAQVKLNLYNDNALLVIGR